jgi:hypothetical protein
MPAFWSSKPKAPALNTANLAPTSNPTSADDRAFSTTTQGTRSSEEDDVRSGQTTPKPSGIDNRIPAIPSVHSASFGNDLSNEKMLHSPTPTPRQTASAGNGVLDIPPPPTPAGAAVGPPKGRLTATILQARNLKISRPDVLYFQSTNSGGAILRLRF